MNPPKMVWTPILLSISISRAVVADPGCDGGPPWPVSWETRLYTYCDPPADGGWHSGGCAWDFFANGTFKGIQGLDHACGKDRGPDLFGTLDKTATMIKALHPEARVLLYRHRPLGTPVWDYTWINATRDHPDYFLSYPNGSLCRWGDFKRRASTFLVIPDCRNPKAMQWWIDNVVLSTLKVGDGAWLDFGPVDSCLQYYNDLEQNKWYAGFDQAMSDAHAALIKNGGFEYGCFQFQGGPTGPGDACRTALLEANATTNTSVVMYGSRHGHNPHPVPETIAAFLLARKEHWWLHGMGNNTKVMQYILMDPGVPDGVMEEASPGVFRRQFSKLNVQLDCSTFTATFTPR
eukprot:m.65828 g.65828  ORF g.65828 m.65828 type:complete len:348 (+) comp8318_c0_seq1:183-1226(+)